MTQENGRENFIILDEKFTEVTKQDREHWLSPKVLEIQFKTSKDEIVYKAEIEFSSDSLDWIVQKISGDWTSEEENIIKESLLHIPQIKRIIEEDTEEEIAISQFEKKGNKEVVIDESVQLSKEEPLQMPGTAEKLSSLEAKRIISFRLEGDPREYELRLKLNAKKCWEVSDLTVKEKNGWGYSCDGLNAETIRNYFVETCPKTRIKLALHLS